MTKAKWVELSPWQILAIEEALNNGIPHADKPALETLKRLISSAKKIKVQ